MTDRGTSRNPQPRLLYVATIAPTISHFFAPYGRHFRALGWHVAAAANGVSGDGQLQEAFDEINELPLSRSVIDIRGILRGYRAVDRLLRTERPDIVHVHTPIAAAVTRLAARRMARERRPSVIYTAHGFHFHPQGGRLSNLVFLLIERVAGRWTDRLIVINRDDEAAARHHRIVPRSRLVRHPGVGLDTTFYDPARVGSNDVARALGQLDVPLGVPLFVTVGELNENKRQADAVRAVAAMQDRTSWLVLVGDGPLRDELAATAERLGVRERIRFAGHIGDIRPILCAATALVHVSRREGLSRAVMEALALGTPVIASAARGNAELVEDNGRIVAIGDVPGLAAAMDEYARHPDDARSLGLAARPRIVERYELQSVIQQHQRLYETLLAGRQSRVAGAAPARRLASRCWSRERSSKS